MQDGSYIFLNTALFLCRSQRRGSLCNGWNWRAETTLEMRLASRDNSQRILQIWRPRGRLLLCTMRKKVQTIPRHRQGEWPSQWDLRYWFMCIRCIIYWTHFFSIWRSLEWITFNGSISASVQRFSSASFWSPLEWWARMARRNTWHSTRARWSPTSTRSGKRTGGSHESGSHNNLRPRQPPIVVLHWPHNRWDN